MLQAVKENIGLVIREERDRQNITQTELCRRAGISQSYLSLIENGDRAPSTEALDKIGRGLGVPAFDLMDQASRRNGDEFKFVRLLRKLAKNGSGEQLLRLKSLINSLE